MKLSKWCKKNGVCYCTGLNWFHAGLIPQARQLPTGTILVDEDPTINTSSRTCVYCRVSNASRKEELEYQVNRCLEFCQAKGLSVDKVYKEVASGMNDKRREFWNMLDSKPSCVVIEHKDRLTRFGFEYLERLLRNQNCEVIVMNRDHKNENDLIKDLVSIITSFCCRIYGLRRGRDKSKKIKEVLHDTLH